MQADSSNYYALFFITKHLKGLEKAVTTKWELDKLCGKGFEKKQPQSLFETEDKEDKKENCLEKFKSKLMTYLRQERTNKEIYLFALTNGFLIKHTNDILKKLQSDGKLDFDRKVRKSSFYLSSNHYKDNEIKYKVKINE